MSARPAEPLACCEHPPAQHDEQGRCRGQSMSGGPSGILQWCGCTGRYADLRPTPEPRHRYRDGDLVSGRLCPQCGEWLIALDDDLACPADCGYVDWGANLSVRSDGEGASR